MPIYAYKCSACGHARDVLQKMSDPVLTVCPACGAESFTKQLTAAGFQLKGSGWYATDFKGGGAPAPAAGNSDGGAAPAGKDAASGACAAKEGGTAAPAAAAPTSAPAPAASSASAKAD
ncbi:MAG: FmdB family zinc ribbon protein [Giesbergeria sp.]